MEEDEQASRRYRLEFATAEKSLGRPLLAVISRQLPDGSAIRALLASWLRAYDLDVGSLEEEHVSLIQQALYDYLDGLIEGVTRGRAGLWGGSGGSSGNGGNGTSVADGEGAKINVNRERLQAAAHTNAILLS